MESKHEKEGLEVVAVLEAIKGLLVLLAGFGLLTYIHKDLHAAAARLVMHFHLNAASRYPQIFIDLADHITSGQLWILASSALLYAVMRLVEAYGLWHQRTWAEWLGLVTGGIYIPLEVLELARGASWPKVSLFTVNAVVVSYLSVILYQTRKKRKQARNR